MADRYEAEAWKKPSGVTLWRVRDLTSGEYVREPGGDGTPQVFASEPCTRAWINREHEAATH